MAGFSIGQLARRAGIEASAIRYYERIGLLPPASRINGRRVYQEDTYKRLILIRATKSVGFTIAEILTLFSAWESQGRSPREWPVFVRKKIDELEESIARARTVKRVLSEVLACTCWDELTVPLDGFISSLTITPHAPPDGAASVRISPRRAIKRNAAAS